MGKVKNNKIIFGQVAVDTNQYNKLDRNIILSQWELIVEFF